MHLQVTKSPKTFRKGSKEEGNQKAGMALFYMDSGPREEWDYLLNKQASQLSRTRGWKGKVFFVNLNTNIRTKIISIWLTIDVQGKGGPVKTVASFTKFNPVQSKFTEKQTSNMMDQALNR